MNFCNTSKIALENEVKNIKRIVLDISKLLGLRFNMEKPHYGEGNGLISIIGLTLNPRYKLSVHPGCPI